MILLRVLMLLVLFFFNDTATTEIYTLSLHDALPIYRYFLFVRFDDLGIVRSHGGRGYDDVRAFDVGAFVTLIDRSEEHTSELQSRLHLVCRLLLEKKNKVYQLCYTRAHTRETNLLDP